MGPSDLEEIIHSIEIPLNESVIVGPGDDAGVYLLDEHRALVETVDVITPIVNDPFTFGSISAVNSLSDVYAMGGKPLTALAIIGFSSCDYEPNVIKEILKGALDTLRRAGVTLLGGHSFEDPELKFGLSVAGIVAREKVLKVSGAMPGDILVLTKPIGIGVTTTALKGNKISDEEIGVAREWMLTLNDKAAEVALSAGATAATDVTGFGLLGHAYNMVRDSNTDFVIQLGSTPVFSRVQEFISAGIVPEGSYNNLKFLMGKVDFDSALSEDQKLVLSDPQTSGGLLMTIPEENIGRIAASGIRHWFIGRVEQGSGRIRVKKGSPVTI